MAETGPRRALHPLASPPESGVPPRASRGQEERPAHVGGNGEPWAGWAPVSRGATRWLRDGRLQPFPKGPFPARPPARLRCTLPWLVRPGLALWAVPRVLGAPGGLSPWRALAPASAACSSEPSPGLEAETRYWGGGLRRLTAPPRPRAPKPAFLPQTPRPRSTASRPLLGKEAADFLKGPKSKSVILKKKKQKLSLRKLTIIFCTENTNLLVSSRGVL